MAICNHSPRAITLIELIVTVIILAILSGFTVGGFNRAMSKGQAKKAKTDLLMIKTAQQVYYAKHGYHFAYTPVHGGGAPGNTSFSVFGINSALDLDLKDGEALSCPVFSHFCTNRSVAEEFDCSVMCFSPSGPSKSWFYKITQADDMPICGSHPAYGPCPE